MKQLGGFLKRYFIPHENNDYKPHILQKSAALGILLLILTTFTAVNIQSLVLISSDWYASSILPAVLVDLTNDNRAGESLGTLSRSAVLDEAARMKAEDMAKKEYFAHNSPEGLTPWYWFGKVGYDYAFAGENLAVHFTDSDEVVKAWMNSPGHRANIMDSNYTEIGIGTARGSYKGSPTIFVVQLFGKPLSIQARAKVVAAVAVQDKAFEESLDTVVAGASDEAAPSPAPTPAEQLVASSTTDVPPQEEVPSNAPSEMEDVALSTQAPPTPTPRESISLFDVATVSPFVSSGVVSADLLTEDENTGPEMEHVSTPLGQVAGRPNAVIALIYTLLAILVFGALLISIAVEWRRHHPVQMLYGAGLLAAMWVALYIHTALFTGALVI